MKKIFAVLLILAFAVAGAALAQGIGLTGEEYRFDNCSSSGSSSQTLPKGSYLLTISSQEDVFLCMASTCASNGKPYAAGSAVWIKVPDTTGQVYSCRSSSSTGDAHFAKTY